MIVTKFLALALSGAALLLSHAQATFDFPDCVDSCIVSSGCQPTNAKCMCKKAAEDLLLDSVVSCLFFSCKSDLRNFEASFLGPIEQGCDDSDRDIPSSKLKAAESLASSWISKLPATTTENKGTPTTQATSTPPKTTAKLNPTATSKQAASSSTTTTSDDDSASTSTSNEVNEQSTTSAAAETTAAPTQVTVSTTVTRNPAASSASPGSNSGSGSDTNPFGGSSSAASAIQPLLSLFGLPLALGLLALR